MADWPQAVGEWLGSDEAANFAKILRDIVIAFCAPLGIFISYKGLVAWRKQLRGTSEHEQARNTLLAAYMIREQIKPIRNRIKTYSTPDEETESIEDRIGPNLEKYFFEPLWKEVLESTNELRLESLKGSVYWPEIEDKSNHVVDIVQELWSAIIVFVEYKKTGEFSPGRFSLAEVHDMVNERGDGNDVLGNKLEAAVTDIQEYLQPKLH